LHLLYARFWHKVLYDLGYVSTKEPFQCLRNQGLVTSRSFKKEGGGYVSAEDVEFIDGKYVEKCTGADIFSSVEKMSKSKLNGVSPDEIIEEFGADSLRLYELFMTPFDKEKLWQSDAVSGQRRFLSRVYDMVVSDKLCVGSDEGFEKLIHRLVKAVGEDLENLSFNTAIAKMMEFVNAFSLLDKYPREILKKLCQLIYPFAPHFGAEAFSLLGFNENIVFEPFPEYAKKYLEDDEITIVFQVMGKLRSSATFSKDVSKEQVLEQAKKDPKVLKYLQGEIVKEIFVPNKLLNFVLKM
jgi:leucyl-tRNA synthetase